ncbi:transport protein [Xanthomonas oryzae pv. oryzicola BLS256]|uniref:Transport protein n=1 Tax=Xanthomonas oryzae pv. oryzicola (strain BLS256) TaxID=383407 RepID=G7TI83_XANOB|nr:transport protein [Xanthomonas oryzae pv. oryzicola BLS256]
MSQPAESSERINVVVLLGAAVVAIPLFRRLGPSAVLGCLAAGLAIGPFGLGLFDEPQAILHVAESGVVIFLFVIGLECVHRTCGACARKSSGRVRCRSRFARWC